MTRWYRELELVRVGRELERLARDGDFSPWLCGLDAIEHLFGPIETLRASGRSLEVVAADLCELGFRIAGRTLGASLRAIRARMEADLELVFSELDVTAFQADGPPTAPPQAVIDPAASRGGSPDLEATAVPPDRELCATPELTHSISPNVGGRDEHEP